MREQCPLVNLPVTEVQSFQLSTGQSESSVVPSRCSAVPQWYSNWPAELSVRPKPSDCIAIGFVLICALGHTHSHTLTLSLSPAVSTVAAHSSALSLSLILSPHSLPASNRWRAQALALAPLPGCFTRYRQHHNKGSRGGVLSSAATKTAES